MEKSSALANASLTNTETDEVLFFQFHPTTLEERISVELGRALPLFASHEVSHYNGTRSEVISLRLMYTSIGGLSKQSGAAFSRNAQGGIGGPFAANEALPTIPGGGFLFEQRPDRPRTDVGLSVQDVRTAERFLKALCYGNQISSKATEGARSRKFSAPAPPLVLFNWPETISLEGYIDRVTIRFDRFDSTTLQPLVLTANIDFREETNRRITGKDVRIKGSNRAVRRSAVPRIRPKERTIGSVGDGPWYGNVE